MAEQLQAADSKSKSVPLPEPATDRARSCHPWSARSLWRQWIQPIGAAVLLVTIFKSMVVDWYDVPTGSMEPSIVSGDRIGVNKLAYDLKVPFTLWRMATWSGPARGDVVILLSPKDGTRLMKRVIGLPGETVAMRDNHLSINGQTVEYEPNSHLRPLEGFQVLTEMLPGHKHPVMTHLTSHGEFSTFQPVVVPEDHYMVMGDHRDLSADSRVFGFVPRRLILGRAGRVIISLDHKNWWRPRWNRFFDPLPS